MTMAVGTATVTANSDGSGTYGGSGMAMALIQARFPSVGSAFVTMYGNPLPSDKLTALQNAGNAMCDDAQNDASAFVTYMQANAVAHVTSEQLGRIPVSITTGTPIEAPASAVDVPVQ